MFLSDTKELQVNVKVIERGCFACKNISYSTLSPIFMKG